MADTTYLKENLQGFVPTPTAAEIIADVVRGSSVMQLSTVQPMKSEMQKFPVMTEGPGAYWVGETERIKTSVATWIFPELVAKKIGIIVPCSKEKLEDTTTNVFAESRPYIAEAFYKAIDAACLFGTNSPFAKNIFGNELTLMVFEKGEVVEKEFPFGFTPEDASFVEMVDD